MKAVFIRKYGGSDELIYGDIDKPVPGNGDVLIKTAATSINPVDWKVRQGNLKFITGRKFPFVVGTELSGIVAETGSEVTRFHKGDRVFAVLGYKGGACAEYVSVKQEQVVNIPATLTFELASTLAVAGVTPLQAFTLHYKVKPGDEVLVNGASGGVGSYAVQIAKLLGARVTGVCSDKNADYVTELGADEVIDYKKENFLDRENAFDVILDAASNAFFPEAKRCLKRGGMLIKLNMSISSVLKGLWNRLFSSRKMKLILLKNRHEDIHWLAEHIVLGKIKVHVDKTYSLKETRKAHEYSQTGRVRGKIVINVE